MAVIKDARLNGAELVRELAKTGTADAKLALARQVLAFVHRKEKRVATAAEVIEAMEWAGMKEPYKGHPRTPELTLLKARGLALKGKWDGPVEERIPTVEERILAGDDLPPETPPPSAVEEALTAPEAEPETLAEALANPEPPKPAARAGRPKRPATAAGEPASA